MENKDKIKEILKIQNYLSDFGYYIFRIREANEGGDYILYNIKKKTYNIYSKKKIYEIFSSEIGQKKEYELSDHLLIQKEDLKEHLLLKIIILVDNISFYPKEELLIFEGEKVFFNTYKKPFFMVEADKEEDKNKDYSEYFGGIKNLLMHICVEEDVYNYVCKWYASKIQYPEIKLPTCLIFQSEKGTGKTFFQENVIRKIFGNLWVGVNPDNFEEKYNSFMFGSLLVHLEEAISDETKEKTAQKLKNYISDTTISIRRMNQDPYNVKCYAQITENTNTHKPVYIEENDRRYIVIGYQKKPIDKTIIKAILENLENEVKAFYYYLKNLKFDINELYTPLNTEAKQDIRKYNMSSLELFFEEFDFSQFERLELINDKFYETNLFYNKYINFCSEYGYKNIFSRNKFTMYLKIKGYKDKVIRHQNKLIRCIQVIKDDE